MLSNVVPLPHIGSATHETRHGVAQCKIDNLIKALSGAPLTIMLILRLFMRRIG